MAKQKEIKFRRDGKLFYGQQNGVKYSIHEARRLHEDESEQYYVSVNYPNERHRSFTTNGYRTSYNNNYGLRRGSQPRLFPSQSRSC